MARQCDHRDCDRCRHCGACGQQTAHYPSCPRDGMTADFLPGLPVPLPPLHPSATSAPRCAFCRGQGRHQPGCNAAGQDFAEQMDKVGAILKDAPPIPRYAKMYVVHDRSGGAVYLVTTSHIDAKREQRRHHRALLKELSGDTLSGWRER